MADEDKGRLEKIARLTALQLELMAKLHEVTREIEVLATGGKGIGELMKDGYAAYELAWCQRYAPGQTKGYIWRGRRRMLLR